MSGILGLIHEFADEDVSVETLDGLSTDPRKPGGQDPSCGYSGHG